MHDTIRPLRCGGNDYLCLYDQTFSNIVKQLGKLTFINFKIVTCDFEEQLFVLKKYTCLNDFIKSYKLL